MKINPDYKEQTTDLAIAESWRFHFYLLPVSQTFQCNILRGRGLFLYHDWAGNINPLLGTLILLFKMTQLLNYSVHLTQPA